MDGSEPGLKSRHPVGAIYKQEPNSKGDHVCGLPLHMGRLNAVPQRYLNLFPNIYQPSEDQWRHTLKPLRVFRDYF